MPAYSFKERFVPLVKDGSKTQTIRAKRKHKIRAGDPVYLYYGMRTKHCIKIGEGVCRKVQEIKISATGILRINGCRIPWEDYDTLAIADGFKNYREMILWWKETNGLPFNGNIIHWILK